MAGMLYFHLPIVKTACLSQQLGGFGGNVSALSLGHWKAPIELYRWHYVFGSTADIMQKWHFSKKCGLILRQNVSCQHCCTIR